MFVNPSDAIRFNVGGQCFDTSRATLSRGAPKFFELLQQHAAGENSAFLIDRDPKHFSKILNFLRNGVCPMPDTIAALLELRAEAEAYQVDGLLEIIDSSPSMRVHRRLAAAANSRDMLQAAADALLAYAFGRDGSEAWPGMMADAVSVDVRVALAATPPVQGRYRCRLDCSISGPAAVKGLKHEYEAAGEVVEPPLASSNLRSPFYHELSLEQQAVWDELAFLRRNADAIAYLARQDSCFRVALQLIKPEAPVPSPLEVEHVKREWRPVYDTTLRFEVRLV